MADLPSWWDAVRAPFRNRGVPVDYWLAILFAESSGNPAAHNPGTAATPEDSVGLFQLNRKGGQGMGYSVEQLMNPALNAEIASRYIAEGWQRCRAQGDLSVACVAVNSGHPGPVPRDDRRILRIVQLHDAIRSAGTEQGKWSAGVNVIGQPPPDGPGGGNGWLPSLPEFPSGAEIGQGLVNAAWESTMRGISAAFNISDPRDLGWSIALGVGSMLLISAGLVGLAVKSGAPEKTAGLVAAVVPDPRVRIGAATVAGASRAAGRLIP